MDSRASALGIRIVFPTHSEEVGADKILEQAVPVPSEIARFENQQVVFLTRLLTAIDRDAAVRCVSERGETITIPADKRGQYSLLSTNVPSWKLVPGGSNQLHEITVPRFVLRDVAVIEVGVDIEQEQASDKVFTNLTDALMEPESVRFLNLTSARIEEFPLGIFEFVHLESLKLGKNQIRTVPPEIGQLRNLKVLKLSHNEIERLPEEIGRLKLLEELHISRNQLDSLPQKFWNLQQLGVINLGENRLTAIPDEIQGLTGLREIELAGNPIPEQDRHRIEQLIPHAKVAW